MKISFVGFGSFVLAFILHIIVIKIWIWHGHWPCPPLLWPISHSSENYSIPIELNWKRSPTVSPNLVSHPSPSSWSSTGRSSPQRSTRASTSNIEIQQDSPLGIPSTLPIPIYPKEAQEQGIESCVTISLPSLTIVKSSGFDMLDQSVLKALTPIFETKDWGHIPATERQFCFVLDQDDKQQ